MAAFPLTVFGASLTMKYLPIRLIYNWVGSSPVVNGSWFDYGIKFVEAMFYGLTVPFPAITVFCIFLILLIFLEGDQALSIKLLTAQVILAGSKQSYAL